MKYPAHLPVLLALSAVLFLVNLGATDLWAPDEARFAEVAREMVLGGPGLAATPGPALCALSAGVLLRPVGTVARVAHGWAQDGVTPGVERGVADGPDHLRGVASA